LPINWVSKKEVQLHSQFTVTHTKHIELMNWINSL